MERAGYVRLLTLELMTGSRRSTGRPASPPQHLTPPTPDRTRPRTPRHAGIGIGLRGAAGRASTHRLVFAGAAA